MALKAWLSEPPDDAGLADVELTLTEFNMTLYEAQRMVQQTRVFIGMHGAGLMNFLWAPPGSVLVQLFPYGWARPDGQPLTGKVFRNVALAASAHYLEWINHDPGKGFLRTMDVPHGLASRQSSSELHPEPNPHATDFAFGLQHVPKPWKDQHTMVDLATFRPVLEKAFRLAYIPLSRKY